MKTPFPTLSIPLEVFQAIVRMHCQCCTYAQIGAAVGMSAQEVEDLRWKHLDRWLHERETIGRAVRSDLVMAVVARIQLILSITENPKDIALLTKAMESLLKHDTMKPPRPTPAVPTMPTKCERSIPAPATETEQGEPAPEPLMPDPAPVSLTTAELVCLQTMRDASPTNTELLYKMQQTPTLYDKCVKLGALPMIEEPEPKPSASPNPAPASRPNRSWAQRLLMGVLGVLVAVNVYSWGPPLREYLVEPAPLTKAQPQPPNR